MTTKYRFYLLLPLSLVLAFGCGGGRSTVAKLSGKVTYKGSPVTGGTLTLLAAEGGSYSVPINSDGTYSSVQLPTGEMKVSIDTESLNPNKPKPQQYGGKQAKGMVSPTPDDAPVANSAVQGTYVKIPPKYVNPQTSGLTLTLDKGSNEKNFDLTD